jgi:hypothetical protein
LGDIGLAVKYRGFSYLGLAQFPRVTLPAGDAEAGLPEVRSERTLYPRRRIQPADSNEAEIFAKPDLGASHGVTITDLRSLRPPVPIGDHPLKTVNFPPNPSAGGCPTRGIDMQNSAFNMQFLRLFRQYER